MAVALALALVTLAAAHLWLVAGLVASLLRSRAYWRAVAALFVPPLAPVLGFGAGVGLRRTAFVWSAALTLYTLLLIAVAITSR